MDFFLILPEKEGIQFRKGGTFQIKLGCRGRYNVRPETIGQFTGLLDKKGKEIYEGDIIGGLKTKTGTLLAWPVVFHFDGWKIGGGKHFPHRPNKGFWVRHAIIGNIHSNPELLNP